MASISARTGRSLFAGRPSASSSASRPGVSLSVPTALGRLRLCRGRPSFVCCASDTANSKLIASSEIPLVFPREDFTLQLYRWAKIEAEANGLMNFGAAMDIQPTLKDPNAADGESELWGFDAFILRDGPLASPNLLSVSRTPCSGVTVCQVGVYMDHERVKKHEFVGIGEDRFPVEEGRIEILEGKELQIWCAVHAATTP